MDDRRGPLGERGRDLSRKHSAVGGRRAGLDWNRGAVGGRLAGLHRYRAALRGGCGALGLGLGLCAVRGSSSALRDLGEPEFSVGDVVDVGGGSVHEPGDGIVGAAGGLERRGVCVEEPGGHRPGLTRSQILGLQGHNRLFGVAQIHARAGLDDAHLGCLVTGQGATVVTARDLDRAFRPAESALGVGDQRKKRGVPGDPTRGPEFGDRFLPLARGIGRDADGLPDHADAGRATTCGTRVLESQKWILVEKPRHHHQMPGNTVGISLVESQQVASDLTLEIGRRHVVRNHRTRRTFAVSASPPA